MKKIYSTSNLKDKILENDVEVEVLKYKEINNRKYPEDDFLFKNHKSAYLIWLKLRVRNTINDAYLYLNYELKVCWDAYITKEQFLEGINYLLDNNYIAIKKG